MFFLLFKRTDDAVFDDFPKISDYFLKISEDFRFRTFSEDYRRLPKATEDVSITHQQISV